MLVDSARKYKTKGRSIWRNENQSYYTLCIQRRILEHVYAAAGLTEKYKHSDKKTAPITYYNRVDNLMTTSRAIAHHFKKPHTHIVKVSENHFKDFRVGDIMISPFFAALSYEFSLNGFCTFLEFFPLTDTDTIDKFKAAFTHINKREIL